jgi:putative endonuclease
VETPTPPPEPIAETPAPTPPPRPAPASNRTVARRAAQQTGQRAELVAAWLLRLTGFRILARNYRTPVGEIDLVARRRRLLVFVEVKSRATDEAAASSITQRQRDRICRAAELFLAARPELGDCAVRFDAVIVAPGRFPRHIKDTWRQESGA